MPIYTVQLIDKREIAKETIQLTFTKPNDLTFKPGQYAGFTLIKPSETDKGGITRRFSLLSSPDDNYIAIATRLQNSAYKRVLNKLTLGDEIKFAGPTGSFVLEEDPTNPVVFIAGGIGITPFYSMIQHAYQHHSPRRIFLFYGNRSTEDTAFLNELLLLENKNPNFTLITTMAMPDKTWSGESGFITDNMINKYINNLSAPIYYICGSPAMVTALQEILIEMGIAEEKIRVEDFPGY